MKNGKGLTDLKWFAFELRRQSIKRQRDEFKFSYFIQIFFARNHRCKTFHTNTTTLALSNIIL